MALLSAFLVPIVYAAELVLLAMSLNLPVRQAIATLLVAAIVVEEIAKSIGIAVLAKNHVVHRWTDVVGLSFVSAAGFLVTEKLLLLLSLSIVTESELSAVLFSSGMFLIPLFAHFLFTTVVCLLARHPRIRYPYALVAGSILHVLYNLVVLGGLA